jgi:hypothetical protein
MRHCVLVSVRVLLERLEKGWMLRECSFCSRCILEVRVRCDYIEFFKLVYMCRGGVGQTRSVWSGGAVDGGPPVRTRFSHAKDVSMRDAALPTPRSAAPRQLMEIGGQR